MEMRIHCILLVLVLAAVCTTEANSPGFKARITDKGLKYDWSILKEVADDYENWMQFEKKPSYTVENIVGMGETNSVAMEALKQSLMKTKIPDQSGKEKGFKYSITNVRVSEFNPPTSDISINPGVGLTWKAANAYIAIKGDFGYKKLFFKGDGSFDAKFSDVDFNLGFVIGSDSTGRPTIATKTCKSDIGGVDFKFHGGMSWLYNLFRKQVGKAIKNLLNSQMCTLIKREVDVDGSRKLAKVQMTAKLGKDYLLDYSLAKSPVFTAGFLETFHKGEIYWRASPEEATIPVPTLPETGDTDHMLYLWVTDYMCNTMMYNAQKHGALKYNLTAKDLPASQRGVLNATCTGFIPKCVGKLIPGVSSKYPNSIVELHMNSTKRPDMKISPSGIAMSFEGLINMFANRAGQPLAFLVTLDAKMSITVETSIANQLLYAKIKDINIQLKTVRSAVGPISDPELNFIVKEVLNIFLVPKLNDLGQKGLSFPMSGDFIFQNTKLMQVEDAIIVATDVQQVNTAADDDMTLRYKPQKQ